MLNIYVVNTWLISRYFFVGFSVGVLLRLWFYLIGVEFVDFCVSFPLSEND